MGWQLSKVIPLKRDIYQVTAVELDAQEVLTGEQVSMQYCEKVGYPQLQADLLKLIDELEAKKAEENTKLVDYKSNVDLSSAKIIGG